MPDEPIAVVPDVDAARQVIDRWWVDFEANVAREGVRPLGGIPIRFAGRVPDEQPPEARPWNPFKEEEGKRGEELFHLILSGIREIYDVDAIIAGGAVRDLAAGITNPKDVDVFVPLTWKRFAESMEELGWQETPFKIGKPKAARNYDGKMDKVVESEDRASAAVQGVAVDLVFTKKPLDLEGVATFPVHAQRCVWTLEGGTALSPEATKDILEKTFTIDPTITDKERLKNVLEKVNGWKKREHYKDWKIVEPDIKEWWEAKEEVAKAEKEKKKGMQDFIDWKVKIARW